MWPCTSRRPPPAAGASVELAFADRGYGGERPARAADEHGIALEVMKLPEAKRGFVLLPKRRMVERSFARATRSCRPVEDNARLQTTLAGLHAVAFACLMRQLATEPGAVHHSL